jgi:ParB-like chromosome segregation protein Spo0J
MAKTAFEGSSRGTIFYLNPEKIRVDLAKNTSRPFGPKQEEFEALKQWILKDGRIIQPIVVTKVFDSEDPEVVAGYQRVLVARDINKDRPEDQWILVPAVYEKNLSDADREELNIAENVGKVAISPIERAYLMHRYSKMGRSNEWIAEKFGVKASSVTQQLKVMRLPREYHERIHRGEIEMNVAIFAAEMDPQKRDEVIAEARQESGATKPSLAAVQAVARKREALPADKSLSRKMSEVKKFFEQQQEELMDSKARKLAKDLLLYFAGEISDQAMQNRLIKYTDGESYSGQTLGSATKSAYSEKKKGGK